MVVQIAKALFPISKVGGKAVYLKTNMDPSNAPVKLNPDRRIINRIPGKIPPPSPKEKDGYIDLKKMSVPALKELLQRQIGILSNRLVWRLWFPKQYNVSRRNRSLIPSIYKRKRKKTCLSL